MKKLIATLLIASMLCGCGAAESKIDAATATGNAKNEASTENKETEILADLEDEVEPVTDLDESSEPKESSNVETIVTENGTYTVVNFDSSQTMYANTTVNIRSTPDQSGEKLGSISLNAEIIVIGKCNETGWYKVQYNGTIGYICDSYLAEAKVSTASVNSGTTENTGNSSSNSGFNSGGGSSNSGTTEKKYSDQPQYGHHALYKVNSSYTPETTSGWDYEKCYKYYQWEIDANGNGSWVAKYEGDPSNNVSIDLLIPYADNFDIDAFPVPPRAGSYAGEQVRNDYVVWVYLGGGKTAEGIIVE